MMIDTQQGNPLLVQARERQGASRRLVQVAKTGGEGLAAH